MTWSLSGTLIESCNCNMFCPCWYAAPEVTVFDQERCVGAIALRFGQGNADGVNLGGRTAVITVDWPGPTILDGNGTARLWLDEGASPEQRAALEAILTGKQGGPMEVLGGLVSTWLSTKSAQIDVEDAGETMTVAVGKVGRIQSKQLTDVQGQGFMLRGGGLVGGLGMEEAELAPSTGTSWTDPEFRQLEGISGARGSFNWSA